ncbi:MAG: HAD-IIIA family hydrolase [Phycisphaerae bacterium]|nr:HAD-IIIA family hydrolase [Gemmatimonadaceae bacterium]
MSARGALFLDRDGTIITDEHYLNDPDGVQLLPGALTAITRANAAAVPVVVVTNQSGIGRGLISRQQYEAVASRLCEMLEAGGARVDATYFADDLPGTEHADGRRKPGLGMYREAAADLELDLAKSAYIGDKWRDVQAALTTNGLGILVPNGHTELADIERAALSAHTAADIEQAVTRALVWMRAGE